MSLWRNKEMRKKNDEAARRIREQCDEYDRTEIPKFKSGGLVSDFSSPTFEGVGDTMGFDSSRSFPWGSPFEAGVYNQGETVMGECVWCGSYGAHKPDCKALSRNYSKSSLSVQREMTERIRSQMDQVESTIYRGAAAAVKYRGAAVIAKPEPPKDMRTEMQKRFDAIAEELENGGK